MKDYRTRIENALKERDLSIRDLVNHLKMPEYEIFEGLENQTLQQRTIMSMAKFLHVPIYNFFYPADPVEKRPFSNLSQLLQEWQNDEETSPNKLQEEIEFLQQIMDYKKEQLAMWQTQEK